MRRSLLLLLALMGLAATFSAGDRPDDEASIRASAYLLERNAWIDSVAQIMTLEQKVGQFFMVATYTGQGQSHFREIERLVRERHVGGLIVFKGHPTAQVKWINRLQSAADLPLWTSIDGEWGVNMRLDSTVQWPRQLTLGALRDASMVYDMGRFIAQECRTTGVQINLAPVVDVNSNPANPVIGDRSFGEDRFNVALKGTAYMDGLQENGVMAVAKHYPGHGDTDSDSHKTLPVLDHDRIRLMNVELFPFRALFNQGVMGVMAAHLSIPALDPSPDLPVSMSPTVTDELLRDSLGFDGLVFSDALNMRGVTDHFAPGEADLQAFMAGNDILLFSEDVDRGHDLIVQAVLDGEIARSEINARLRRILRYKYDLGLHTWTPVPETSVVDRLNPDEAVAHVAELYKQAITVVANETGAIPLRMRKRQKLATLSIGTDSLQTWQHGIDWYGASDHFFTGKQMNAGRVDDLVAYLADYDRVVVGVHDMSRYAYRGYGIHDATPDLVNRLSAETEVVLCLFGSPYALRYFNTAPNVVVAYEDEPFAQQGVAEVLVGARAADGRLPVSAGRFASGAGIQTDELGLLELGRGHDPSFEQAIEDKLDDFIDRMVDERATPGGQVLVVRNGQVVVHRAFGRHRYDDDAKHVETTDLYDIASITKVASTTLAIMKLVEDSAVHLDDRIADHLPEFEGSAVADLRIDDILLHESGLPGWIPFYTSTLNDSMYSLYYCTDDSLGICVRVADSLYMFRDRHDLIWNEIRSVDVENDPAYRYSDLGFYLLHKLVERRSGMSLDHFVETVFYRPMGLTRLAYNPRTLYGKRHLVPTELDTVFRNQLIHGHVHDPGAAMLGGVAGHAGLFANAFDLAAVMQMLLNGGTYNGHRLLHDSTVAFFTRQHRPENRRGLGFDKPVLERDGTGPTCAEVSLQAFGHTGFTGTSVWADPEHDLIYVFLSNRVHPDANNWTLVTENFRTDIQQAVYRQLDTFLAAP